MIGKPAARDNRTNRQFKPQIYQSRRRDKVELFMTHIIMIEEIVKVGIESNSGDRRIQFSRQSRGRLRYEQNYRRGNI